MNLVLVTGGTKKQRKLVEGIVNWCIDELMPRYRTLEIEVNLKNLLEKEGAYGWCMQNDRREFVIDLHKRETDYAEGKKNLIETIMHEMVHVWQYASGTYKQTRAGKLLWKKKDYTTTPYSKQPWQRQAYRMEKKLYAKWLTSVTI